KTEAARERLSDHLKTLVEGVEELLKATAEQSGDGISLLRDRLIESLEQGKRTLRQGRKILQASRDGAETAISYAHENPWAVFGVALGAGAALAFFLLSKFRR
ncbi:MAG TPA: DUF883 family protein, partial [Candidatus Binatia bacterium]|nr:DUF883 family protein [Candidatus Binatia bacterium]